MGSAVAARATTASDANASVRPARTPDDGAHARISRGWRSASSVRTTRSTRLSGVEAPDVRPTRRGPLAGSQPLDSISPGAPTGLCRIMRGRDQARRIGDVVGRHVLGADVREVARVAAVVAADDHHQVEPLVGQQADHGVLPILRGAADRVEGAVALATAPPRQSGRASPRGTSRRSRSTRTSASSSGWPARCGPGRRRDRSPARPRR